MSYTIICPKATCPLLLVSNFLWIPSDFCYFISANLGVKMVMVTKDKVVPRSEVVSAGQQAGTFTETAVITLGEIAASSDKVEGEVRIRCKATMMLVL